jgi:hypothetical protein
MSFSGSRCVRVKSDGGNPKIDENQSLDEEAPVDMTKALLLTGLALQLLILLVVVIRTNKEPGIGLAELQRTISEEVGVLQEELSARHDATDSRLSELEISASKALAAREDDPALEERLSPMLAEVAERVEGCVRDAVAELDRRTEAAAVEVRRGSESASGSPIERVLRNRGFTDIEVIGEPKPEGDFLRVVVEARRDGMAYKGPVILSGDEVLEQRLSPSYPMFP